MHCARFQRQKSRQIIRIPFLKTRFHEKTNAGDLTLDHYKTDSQEGRTEKKAWQLFTQKPGREKFPN